MIWLMVCNMIDSFTELIESVSLDDLSRDQLSAFQNTDRMNKERKSIGK